MRKEIDYDFEESSAGCCMFSSDSFCKSNAGSIKIDHLELGREKISLKKRDQTSSKPFLTQQKPRSPSVVLPIPLEQAAIRGPPSNSIRSPEQAHEHRKSLPTTINDFHRFNQINRENSLSSFNRYSVRTADRKCQYTPAFMPLDRNGVSKNIRQLESPNRQVLVRTTKLAPNTPTTLHQENNLYMQKTKKMPFSPTQKNTFSHTLQFKESVFSIVSQEDSKVSKINQLDESKVLIDFFHPPEVKKQELQSFIQNARNYQDNRTKF